MTQNEDLRENMVKWDSVCYSQESLCVWGGELGAEYEWQSVPQ